MRMFAITALALALVTTAASTSQSATQGGRITITVENFSGFDKAFDLKDGRCGNEWVINLSAWARTTASLCTSDSGYGTLLYKKRGDSGWTQSSLLSNGNKVSM